MKLTRLTLAALSGAALVSCTATQQQWGLGGAAAGGAAGAILGDDSTDILRGAVVGGAAGAGAAAVQEHRQGNQAVARIPANQQVIPAPQQPKPVKTKLPVATPTNVPGIVVSPFPPHNKVNVTGFQSGAKARDPYTKTQPHKGIFLVP